MSTGSNMTETIGKLPNNIWADVITLAVNLNMR